MLPYSDSQARAVRRRLPHALAGQLGCNNGQPSKFPGSIRLRCHTSTPQDTERWRNLDPQTIESPIDCQNFLEGQLRSRGVSLPLYPASRLSPPHRKQPVGIAPLANLDQRLVDRVLLLPHNLVLLAILFRRFHTSAQVRIASAHRPGWSSPAGKTGLFRLLALATLGMLRRVQFGPKHQAPAAKPTPQTQEGRGWPL